MSMPTSLPANLLTETLLGMAEAARRLPPFRLGRPVAPATVWRWCMQGVRLADGTRLRLECIRLGGRWLTSTEALERFVAAQTPERGQPEQLPQTTPAKRARRSERAAAELERMGA
jgi:Protein of unknown function (DUF1580)